MSLLDSASISHGAALRADVCIIGGGPAGLAIAAALEPADMRTVLLESGGLSFEPQVDALGDFESSGVQLRAAEPVRQRMLGGTTATWHGRVGPLDPIDFEEREWVPFSGWPIPAAAVARHAPAAARFLGIRRPEALEPGFWAGDPAFAALGAGPLQPAMHLWPRRLRIADLHLPPLRRSRRVTVVLHAHATRLIPSEGTEVVGSLAVRGLRGNHFGVHARAYVLACGGLENPRILLLSTDSDGRAVGNRHDAVGRYYVNHPRAAGVARFHPSRRRLVRALTEHHDRRAGGRVQPYLRPDAELQRRERLLNCCSFFYPVAPAWLPGMASVTRSAEPRRRPPRRPPSRLGLRLAGRPLPVDHMEVIDQVEQLPDPESRVTLGARRDRFGEPRIELHWRIGEDTTRTLRRVHEALAEHVAAAGIGRLESDLAADAGHVPSYTDAAHPMGTTRMSTDPRFGVVDGDCRVHGTGNLYVAGSSVFPTGGGAPPTLTIVCLALRLADQLRQTLGR